MEQERIVAEGGIDELLDLDALRRHASPVVPDAELALGHGPRGTVVVQGARDLSPGVQVAEAAREMVARGVVEVDPLIEPVLAPELDPPVVVGVGDDVVVADLVPRVPLAAELRLRRLRRGLLVDLVAIRGKAEAVDDPGSEAAAAVDRGDVRGRLVRGQRRRWLGAGRRDGDQQKRARERSTNRHGQVPPPSGSEADATMSREERPSRI